MNQEKTLAIVVCASARYQFAMLAQAVAVQQNVKEAGWRAGHVVLATCEKPIPRILAKYKELLGDGWQIQHIALPLHDEAKSYDKSAQNIIATLTTAAFAKCRALDVDFVWTLDSDVLPDPNNLRCMRDMVSFDGGYYDVAFVPYASAGEHGGALMGGRAKRDCWILPGVYDDEREISPELKARMEAVNAKKQGGEPFTPEDDAEVKAIAEAIKAAPPRGNIFDLQAKGWRRRGWLNDAYPGIGKGAALESDWMPFGNNLFSRKAINRVDFIGYQCSGTQDLYCTHERLAPAGVKICVVPHCVSHHIQKIKDKDGRESFVIHYLYHEFNGECIGHIRQKTVPWYPFVD